MATFLGLALAACGENPAPSPTAKAKESSAPVAAKAAAPASEPATKLIKFKVPMPAEPSSPDIFVIGDDLKIYQKHGIAMDFVGVVPTPQYVAAVVSGRIDVSPGSHINRTIAGVSAGAKIKAVAGKTESTQRVPHMIGIVPKNSPIKKPVDLIGKKVGIPTIGGCNEYTPYAWLNKFGVSDPKNKIEVVVLPEKNLEQVLRQGEIDLAMTHKLPEEITRKDEFRVVFSDYDVWGEDGGATPFYFATKFIEERPDVVRSFVAATAETLNWANDHPDGAREITARRTNTDFNYVNERYYTPNGLLKPEHATVWIELLELFGEIKPGLTVDQIYTNEFNPHYRPGT
ncbi:MAG: ABC transporter substrate-binding protein [Deltaproteobacteria bacterium]|jgi:ABC-type nitrate/sulfonate/bicarbonate transport system substrate-binding protein|nr:ABC transporter substrate-binding protein [Deltaproteobacteria bacterium]